MASVPTRLSGKCSVCGGPVSLMVDTLQGTLRGNRLTVEPLSDRALCVEHLLEITPPDELEALLKKIAFGLAMEERAGLERGVTGWLFALAPEVAGYLH